MPEYTLRTHPDYTLVVPEIPDTIHRDGDTITLSEERAASIAYVSKWHRFERTPDEPLLGHDRHRSGRRPPEGVETDQTDQTPPTSST